VRRSPKVVAYTTVHNIKIDILPNSCAPNLSVSLCIIYHLPISNTDVCRIHLDTITIPEAGVRVGDEEARKSVTRDAHIYLSDARSRARPSAAAVRQARSSVLPGLATAEWTGPGRGRPTKAEVSAICCLLLNWGACPHYLCAPARPGDGPLTLSTA